MIEELRRHPIAYTSLLVWLLVCVAVFFGLYPRRDLQRVVAIVLCAGYTAWGIVTHTKSKIINRAIVKEYVGVGLFGVTILFLLTL